LSLVLYRSPFAAIKNALKQENLNPEIEEKLLNLQRYQERQMKGGNVSYNEGNSSTFSTSPCNSPYPHSDGSITPPPVKSRKRVKDEEDDEWVLDTPRRKYPRSNAATSTPIVEKKVENFVKKRTISHTDHTSSDTVVNEGGPVLVKSLGMSGVEALKRSVEKKKQQTLQQQQLRQNKMQVSNSECNSIRSLVTSTFSLSSGSIKPP
jgi:nucleosome-remodeling factor subunit BPTF